ncbi:thioredoxin family protein [Tenacibaculum discolor]|uniref:Thioredoxin family protein n=1 Tax=Tenacibaculum discolor TaxID=361581 RepID=A0A2G1BZE5_9FLAO|nr:thioredoxin family protein [Tenacibaculum discolor]MDP2541279.1 thioredoxin family protein [Tenacibaculum discolor]PHN98975.1 thioredoxin family protein [Tenacibaculum discolor]PHO01388.1 thioredoxin family protein [Rhodobacteraceae bacterium 4F10]
MKTFKIILMLLVVATISAFTNDTSRGYKIGDEASDFALKNIDGKMVSLADYKEAKGFIVVFTCNMCPYSVANEDRLIALDKKYKQKGFPVIAINPNDPEVSKGDSFEAMKVRAKEKGFTFPYLFDEGQKVYPKYGATRTPHVYILNKKKGRLIVEYIGAIDDNTRDENNVKERFVENAVEALLKGEKPTKTDTRAIGCSIKDKRNR